MAEINNEQKRILMLYIESEDRRIEEKQQEADRLELAASHVAAELEEMVKARNEIARGVF